MNKRGFTLIETMIYLALYGIIVAGAISAAYSIFESSSRNQLAAMVQEEGDYLIGKFDWALSGISQVNQPAAGPKCAAPLCELSVVKSDVSIGTVVLTLVGENIEMQKGAALAEVLNNSNVDIKNLVFTHTNPSQDGVTPESVSVSFTISARTSGGLAFSRDFSTVKYLRK